MVSSVTSSRLEQERMSAMLGVLLPCVLFVLCLFLSACFVPPESGLAPTVALQTSALDATQTAGRVLASTKEASLKMAQQTAESARLTPQPTGWAIKLTPSVVIVSTPAPAIFVPERQSTPAGAGAILNVKLIPPFYTHDFIVENVWYRDFDGGIQRVYVYGGFIPDPKGAPTPQGVVVVQVLKMDAQGNPQMIYYGRFPTQMQAGPVRVTDAVGERLVLESTNGTRFYFDVPLRQFVPSLTWVSPVATPSPQPARP